MRINWKWPSRPDNLYAPWYEIVRRTVAVPLYYFAKAAFFLAYLLGWGYRDAIRSWREN